MGHWQGLVRGHLGQRQQPQSRSNCRSGLELGADCPAAVALFEEPAVNPEVNPEVNEVSRNQRSTLGSLCSGFVLLAG